MTDQLFAGTIPNATKSAISGFLVRNGRGRIVEVLLNQRSPLVQGLSRGLDLLLRPAHIAINWGQI